MARTAHGLPGIYNASSITLSDGDGAALALDVNGKVIMGTITPGTGATSLGKAKDAAHASGDVGVMVLSRRTDTAATSAGTDGDYATINTDSLGHLWVREGFAPDAEDNTNNVYAMAHLPLANSTYAWTRFVDLGANATANVKASAGNVYSAYMENTNAAKRYLQLHNTATTPGGGAVPLYTFAVAGAGSILIGSDFWGLAGANFSTGIAFAFSTTAGTYTAGTAGEQFTVVHYK